MQKYHHDLLVEAEQQGSKIAQQPLFKDKWSTFKCLQFTKRSTYDLIVQDKEPLALLERKGFRRFLKREFPGYSVPDRDKVAQITDECGTESCEAVIRALEEHISKHGTVSSAVNHC